SFCLCLVVNLFHFPDLLDRFVIRVGSPRVHSEQSALLADDSHPNLQGSANLGTGLAEALPKAFKVRGKEKAVVATGSPTAVTVPAQESEGKGNFLAIGRDF